MTISHPEIAPLVAEWIDWIAEPAAGREAASVAHAEEVFTDIRTGRPGWKPWRDRVRLPIESFGEHRHAELTEEERAKLRRAAAEAHDSGAEWRGIALVGLIILALAGGTAWAINHFAKDEPVPVSNSEPAVIASRAPAKERLVLLSDESADVFHASDGDAEPLADTADTIMKLMGVLEGDKPPIPNWDLALKRQAAERADVADGKPPKKEIPEGDAFLASAQIFPFMGRASAGRMPGDYYLVWRTQRLVLTWEECRELQIAILRSARYCGVRLLAWTVLPNQAGVVLRVPAPHPLSDEKLGRRIAILRGEKTAASVIAQIDDKLKAGDEEGAKKVRLTWTASMNSAAGFYGVIKSVPVVKPEFLKGAPLWQDKPLHLSVLDPATSDVLRAAAAVDTAALTAELVESASAWPLCNLTAAIHNYGPAVRAISVLMQRNPQASLPLPDKDELTKSLRDYRIYLGDLTEDSPAVSAPASGTPPPAKEKGTKVE